MKEKLLNKIASLCLKVNKKERLPGWEISLFRCCMGLSDIKEVSYEDRVLIISMARQLKEYPLFTFSGIEWISLQEIYRISKNSP